jgi:Subtilase family
MSARSRSSRSLAAVATIAAMILGGASASGTQALGAAQADGASGSVPVASTHAPPDEVLREPLWRLASARLSAAQRRQLMAGLVIDDRVPGPAIAVSIELATPATPAVAGSLVADGARVVNLDGRSVEAYVSPDRLTTLAGVEGVLAIRPIRPATASGDAGPAVELQGSSPWQAAGLTGDGVKVGIIDGGFGGIEALLGSALPATVHARCYTSVGSFTSNLADCEDGETHGTAVAEAVFDMAPGIDLYIADPISSLDEQRTVTWMTNNGIRIINASFFSGLMFEGPGDGTSPYANSLYSLVDQAVAGGALWVNAAGNAGDSGWTGPWTDADNNSWLDFAPGVDMDGMTLAADEDVTVAIRWADPWGASANNYDLVLYKGKTVVGSSRDIQAGTGDPFEIIEYTATTAGRYDIAIRRVSGAPTSRMQLMVGSSEDVRLTYQVATGTLPTPADGSNPGMLAVGAVNVDHPTEIEPYSSRGPTLDGRVKPDLVAADCAPTATDNPFCGTSESAPFVTGAAAQVLQARPDLTPAELADWLRSHAVALGSPVPNSTFGAGRLDLGPLPFGPAAALAFAWPITGALAGAPLTGQPTVTVVDGTGLVVGAGPASAPDVTLSLASNATGATLSCTGGLTRAAVAGVATFAGCAIDLPGTAYVLQAAAAGLPPLTSAPFDVLAAGSAMPLVLTAAPAWITLGGTAALTARFASSPRTDGRVLQVERSIDGHTWSPVGPGTTDASGTLATSVAPAVSGWYRARFEGAADLPAATSYPVRMIVKQTIALRASLRAPRTIPRGTAVTFTATVRPVRATPPRAVVSFAVYRRVGAAWTMYRRISVTTDASGRAQVALRFGTSGSWYVRAWSMATPSNGSSTWSARARYVVQ